MRLTIAFLLIVSLVQWANNDLKAAVFALIVAAFIQNFKGFTKQ